ncbi:hypothetical protein ANAPC5_01350 [Anaplasma phagocytophilum]|nr:hypothetical protein ANAPC5_01350 [Anaplasma phagocytophilum]
MPAHQHFPVSAYNAHTAVSPMLEIGLTFHTICSVLSSWKDDGNAAFYSGTASVTLEATEDT